MSADRLDPERLAALQDGRLPEAERAALLAELSKSRDDLELLADVAAITGEAETISLAEKHAQRRRWTLPRGGWFAIAAGIIGVSALSLITSRLGREQAIPPGLTFAIWGVERAGDPVVVPPNDNVARSWRVGVRLADARLALDVGDTALTARLSREIVGLLTDPSQGAAVPFFRGLPTRADLERGEAAIAPPLDATEIRLGKWAEMARIAAYRSELGFFERASTRDAIAEITARHRALGEPVSAAVTHLRAAQSADGWRELRSALERLVVELGR